MESSEKITQGRITDWLEKNDIYPFNVIATDEYNGLVSMSFYTKQDLLDLLELIKYKSLCDKTGYELYMDSNTLIIRGMFFVYELIKKVDDGQS